MARLVMASVLFASFAVAGLLAASGGEATIAETVKALYVFGDSYVDTGNTDPSNWTWPFGYTWPGYPTGRFSDGRVLTDYIACSLGLVDLPIPFRIVNSPTKGGINFAYGGSGVFTTHNGSVSNVTTQIQDLITLIESGYIPTEELFESHVLFAVDGNDYVDYLLGIIYPGVMPWTFIEEVVDQMAVDIETLLVLGFRNISITNVGPIDLYPRTKEICNTNPLCFEFLRWAINHHNDLLTDRSAKLTEKFPESNLNILDLHEAFTKVLNDGELFLGPCLKDGPNNTIIVCDHVNNTLFWDGIHPTQAGWFTLLDTTLSANLTNCDSLQQASAKM